MQVRPWTASDNVGPTYDSYSMHFPYDILAMIIKELPVEDHLNLKLTAKSISAVAKEVMDVSVLSREEQVLCHTELEQNAPHGRCYHTLTCSRCSRLLDRSKYIDSQRRKDIIRRICISCAIETKRYGRRKVLFNGAPAFVCRDCEKLLPVSTTKHHKVMSDRPIISLCECCFSNRPKVSLCKCCYKNFGY